MFKEALEQLSYMYSVIKTDRRGLTTVEYAVAGALVAGTVVAAFSDLGTAVEGVIQNLECSVTNTCP